MDKLKMHSPDLSQENIAKIRELFPGCVTEARDDKTGKLRLAVDFDQLKQELSDHIVEGPQERYRLDWPGKREALALANTTINKALRPLPSESLQFDTTKNLFIEGDNLEALKLIQDAYLGQIKMIYIDPPYNTGKDFVYRDSFASDQVTQEIAAGERTEEGARLVANPEGNGRFHSNWLTMIAPRLRLAKKLLTRD
ncbi:MAG: site-specific DNA-methyltransferase, partial [Ectopseudomonas oleovorans]